MIHILIHVHGYTHTQKTPQINAIDSKQSICTHNTNSKLMFNTFTSKAFLFLLLSDAFYIRDTVEIVRIVLSSKEID